MDHSRGDHSECGPECRDLDPREPREPFHNDDKTENPSKNVVRVSGTVVGCACSRAGNAGSSVLPSLGVSTIPSNPAVAANAAMETGVNSSCCSSSVSGGAPSSGARQSAAVGGCSLNFGGDSSSERCTGAVAGESSMYSGGQPFSSGCSGNNGGSRIRRLLRGRTHSSHGATSTAGTSNNASTNAAGTGSVEDRSTKGQFVSCCRERSSNGNIRSEYSFLCCITFNFVLFEMNSLSVIAIPATQSECFISYIYLSKYIISWRS